MLRLIWKEVFKVNNNDINIKIGEYILNCRAVAIIECNNKILFQKRGGDKYWALPGGKIEVGEKTSDTVLRELKEELGLVKCNVNDMAMVAEHFFEFDGNMYHQYIFGHRVSVSYDEYIYDNEEFRGIEKDKNLIFKWFDKDMINDLEVKPDFLGDTLKKVKKREIEFVSYKEK